MSASSSKVHISELRVCHACCCSITGMSCEMPQCFGCGMDGMMCCLKTNATCCKPMSASNNEDGKCCICCEGGTFCVKPTTCVQHQTQMCCLDARCAFPCTEEVPCLYTCLPCCVVYPKFGCFPQVKDVKEIKELEDGRRGKGDFSWDLSDIDVGDVRVCDACCCYICGFLFKYPECIGGKNEGTCCCMQVEQSCCKPITEVNDDQICCICVDGGQYCVTPTTCVQYTETCFCMDFRCALPCGTDKVPNICTCLPCCVVWADSQMKFGCFPKVSDLVEDSKPEEKVVTAVCPVAVAQEMPVPGK